MKKIIRQLLNKTGYDLIKINQHSNDKARKIARVKVGNFFVDMPGNNHQISLYKYHADWNNLLGTISVYMASKYPDVCAVDIGANVGDTIAIIKTVIDIPVIGIEGDPVTYQFLEHNTKQFRNVTLLKQFLGDKKQTLQVEMEKSGWNTTLIPTEKGQELSLKTLDELLEENQLATPNVKILKVDCEGFDTIIIRGATGLLQKNTPVLFFEYNRTNMEAIGEDGLGTLFSLEKYGYRSIIFFDNYGRYMLKVPIDQHDLIKQLHAYSDDNNSRIGYYDICMFHENDAELAEKFIKEVSSRNGILPL